MKLHLWLIIKTMSSSVLSYKEKARLLEDSRLPLLVNDER